MQLEGYDADQVDISECKNVVELMKRMISHEFNQIIGTLIPAMITKAVVLVAVEVLA